MKRKKIRWWKVIIGSAVFLSGAYIYGSVFSLPAPKYLCNIIAFLLMIIGGYIIMEECPDV